MNTFKKKTILSISLSIFLLISPLAAEPVDQDFSERRHFLETSLFFVMDFLPKSIEFCQINYGYRLTRHDTLLIEAVTWRPHSPPGIPFGSSFGSDAEDYAGTIRAIGIGGGYQRFLAGGFYAAAIAIPFLQIYMDADGNTIQEGFQLYLQFRLGYRLELPGSRFYFEPLLSFNWWPVNANVPAAFAARDEKWHNYFLFEPGLSFGFYF